MLKMLRRDSSIEEVVILLELEEDKIRIKKARGPSS
jgi:hypothetical protein